MARAAEGEWGRAMERKEEFLAAHLEAMRRQRELTGDGSVDAAAREWPHLVRQVLEDGLSPRDPRVQQLARRWGELQRALGGGEPGLAEVLARAYREGQAEEGTEGAQDVVEYIARAMAAFD
ncbi:MAG: TipAS antibiotic-recognition domain-containing protein [Syntrophomonadaceae bacterium]|nr:TipAS antibiotic-recognition domain-containing protein [Syntrophomonadaceae bacterium]